MRNTFVALPEQSRRTLARLRADYLWYRAEAARRGLPDHAFVIVWPRFFDQCLIADTRETAHAIGLHVQCRPPPEAT